LLTGSTPIQRKRLKQAAVLEALRIIREEEPPRPSTRLSTMEELPSIAANRGLEPKKLSGLVRGELDWIVMKCLEKDRNRRYETATAIARDVQRYLADEPVQACPPSGWYRFRKFARRNRRMLLSAALVAGALVAATIVLAISNVRVRLERDQKEQALREKEAALVAADANFRKARAAVERSFTLVSESDLFDAAGLEPLRKQLLESALQYYKEFVDQAPLDPKVQGELSAAYFRIWQIYRSVDRYTDSMAALRQALDIAEKLRREHPGNTDVLGTLATVRYGQLRFVGSLHAQFDIDSSNIPEAIRTLERAAALWESLAKENPHLPNFQRNLGEVYDEMANLERGTSEPSRALATARKAFVVWERLDQEHPQMVFGGREKEYRGALLAVYLREGGQPDEAQRLFQRAIDFAQRQTERFPNDRHHRASLAFLYRRLGESFSVYGWRPKEAVQTWQQAISLYENLAAEYPAITSFPWHLGDCCNQLGRVLQRTGRPQEAERSYAKSVKAFEKLASIYPDSITYMNCGREGRLLLARLCLDTRRYQEAENHFRSALEFTERLVARLPAEGSDFVAAYGEFAGFLATCPDAKFRKPAQAVILANKAVVLTPKEAKLWSILGAAHYRTGDWKAAKGALEKALELRKDGDPFDYFFLAMAHWQLGNKGEARKWHDKAVASMDKNQPKDEELFRVRAEAAELLKVKENKN
jgi:tetratricopeptide (TPR) repeat protein